LSVQHDQFFRSDLSIFGKTGGVFAQEMPGARTYAGKTPLLLVHGGGPDGLVSFDPRVTGCALVENLAALLDC
jgi:hypothetical protein